MDSDELLEKMITRASGTHAFEDWADVLSNYAVCLNAIHSKVSPDDMNRLVNAGADFYRTLARAEAHRKSAVKQT